VSEWIRGGSLREVAATAPSPIGSARAIQSLAAAAGAAHKAGVAMGVDDPARLRVSIEGDVALAFPATLADATPEGDIRGVGAALYALLVNRWPLRETGVPSGFEPAELDADGQPLEPRVLDRGIPFQISAAALRSVQDNAGIRTAPTMLNLLQQATAVADRTALLDSVETPPEPEPRKSDAESATDAATKRKRALMIGIAAGVAILLVALLVLASILNKMFGDVGGGSIGDQLGLNAPSLSQSAEPTAEVGGAVKPVRATVFSPDGGADNPADADKAIDGNPNSAWSTDIYTDNVPFPNFKSGVGLMLELPEPTTVGTVTVTVPSTGTVVQVRSASSPDPAALADTTELTQPTTLQPGKNTITVDASAPTSNLLLWISTMGTTAGKNKTEFSEIVVNAVK
ncbi:MAG TPA: murein biosynthesis protein MurJ, partial [Mycobacterium sp.]|nr:murein biosynthesis protein MurJ [Mycobacterium sp.]